MKVRFTLLSLLLSTSLIYAQSGHKGGGKTKIETEEMHTNHEKCGSDARHQHLMKTDPAYVARRQAIENDYQEYLKNPSHAKTTYTIPVVVHVIHTGQAVGTGINISDAQIQSAIDNLNAAYSNTNTAHTTYTGVNTNIQFCLAQRDPSGNPTTGIVRVNGSGVTDYSTKGACDAGGGTGTDNEVAVKALSKWDNTKYYNIWVVNEINDNGGGSGTQGYAYFPGAGASVDGTIILYNAFGYDPDGSLGYNLKSYTNRNVTTVHELGHGLNLHHTFQGDGTGSTCPTDAVCGTSGDCVADTPRHKRSTSGCVSDATANACQAGTTAGDYQHNFMDYSSDICQTEFTAGQSTRMEAVMTGTRAALAASDGCNPVYVNEAGINSIITPASTGECGTPTTPAVVLKNTGSATLTSITITYDIDGGANQVYNWTGSLAQGASTTVYLADQTLTTGSHTFTVTTSLPNGAADPYTANDSKNVTFNQVSTVPTSTCTVTTTNTGNTNTGILRVQFSTIDNAHDDGLNDGTQNFVCSDYANITYGTDYTLTVTTGTSTEYCRVYIDYDDDGNMEAGELVLNDNTTRSTSHSTTVSIPAFPDVTGKMIRMRVISDYNTLTSNACANLSYGEVEDYGLNISTPPCSTPVINTHPTAATGCAGNSPSFSVAATGASLTYQWKVSTNAGFSFSDVADGGVYSGATTNTLLITNVSAAYDQYIYRCFVGSGCGSVTSNSALLTVTASPTASCTPATLNPGDFGTGIVNFVFNTINNSHSDFMNDGTQDFICSNNTSVTPGSTYAFTANLYGTLGFGSNDEYCEVYIDYNDDGAFSAGEVVYSNMATRQMVHTGNITIPTSGAVTGKLLRMRVKTDYGTFVDGCVDSQYGEIEDYGIYIACYTPTVATTTPATNCGAGSLNVGATASNGSIKWYSASVGGTLLGVGTSYTTPSIASTTTYYAEAYDKTCTSASRSAVAANIVNCSSTLTGGSCGVTLTDISEALYSTAVSGATNYRYLVENTATGFSTVLVRGTNDNLLRLSWSGTYPVKYGTTYSVKVSAYVSGAWQAYSTGCNVTTPATRLTECGVSINTSNYALYAQPVAGATDYRFRVQHAGTGYNQVWTRGSAQTLFRLNYLTGISNSKVYTVEVAAYVSGAWQAYGPACNVTWTLPATKLATASCNISIPTMSTALYSDPVSGATNYRYSVDDGSGFYKVSTRNASDNLFRLSWVTGVQTNKTYTIMVSALKDGIWGLWGTPCTINTPSSFTVDNNEEEAPFVLGVSTDFELNTYPNPNEGEFTVSSNVEGMFTITNELGQIVRTFELTKENGMEVQVTDLRHGIYFVSGNINNEVVTRKITVIH